LKRVLLVSTAYIDPGNRGKPRALAARGLDVTVAVPQKWLEPTLGRWIETSWERTQGVEVFPIPVRGAGDPETARFARRPLRALIRDKRPDLVQVEEEPDLDLAAQVVTAARAQKVPCLLFTAANTTGGRGFFASWRRRRALRRTVGVVAASSDAAALVRSDAGERPLCVLPQLGAAVPTIPEHLPHQGLAIGYMGRLLARRGLDTLLEALAVNRAERWQLTVVGDGPDRERLEALATEARLAARVRWTGSLPPHRIAALWPQLDVLVLPSRPEATWREPTAHVLLEAMAHEVAVVGSDTGAIPETIGDAGLVVPAGDATALAAALSRLAEGTVRRPLAQAGRARVMQRYSDDAVAEQTIAFWTEVLKPKGNGS
jgi:glycosyl transferase family 1/glycosyl transferase family 4